MTLKIPKKGSRGDVAAKLALEGKRLLDVGCGSGSFVYLAKDKYEDLYGIDISKYRLVEARKLGIKTCRIDLDVDTIPYPNDYFDTVTCLDVLEHLKDPRKVLNEIYRVLKENGQLIVSTPNIRYWWYIYSLAVLGRFPSTSSDTSAYDGGHIHYFTYSDVAKLMREAGVVVVGQKK